MSSQHVNYNRGRGAYRGPVTRPVREAEPRQVNAVATVASTDTGRGDSSVESPTHF